jgi:hypothetical protein
LTNPSLFLYLGPGPLSALPLLLSLFRFFTYRPNTAYSTPTTIRKATIPIETPRPTAAAALSSCDGFGEVVGIEILADVVVMVVREGESVENVDPINVDFDSESEMSEDSTGPSEILETVVSDFSGAFVDVASTASLDEVKLVGVTVMMVVSIVVSGDILITTGLSPPVLVEAACELELGYMVMVWIVTSVSVMRMRWKMR